MKWFKHDCDMHTNLKVQELIEKEGVTGYAIWVLCLEMVGKEGKRGRIDGQKRWQKGLKKVFPRLDEGDIERILKVLGEVRLINPKALNYGNLYIPEFTKRGDDYTRRKVRRESEQSLPRIDKKRIDKTIGAFAHAKGWLIDKNPALQTEVYRRHCRPAKQLLLAVESNVDRACEIIRAAAKFFKEKDWQWTLETVMKYLPEFNKQNVKKDEYL